MATLQLDDANATRSFSDAIDKFCELFAAYTHVTRTGSTQLRRRLYAFIARLEGHYTAGQWFRVDWPA